MSRTETHDIRELRGGGFSSARYGILLTYLKTGESRYYDLKKEAKTSRSLNQETALSIGGNVVTISLNKELSQLPKRTLTKLGRVWAWP